MKKTFICLFVGAAVHLNALDTHPKICLNMIVKDETPVITRCLASVKPIIDYWLIVDTGSNDGTQTMIVDYMKDIPGELHERPWVDFAHNRNEALELARGKGDYILLIDADEMLSFSSNFKLPNLDKDFYFIETSFGGTKYNRVQLVNNHLDWKWSGVLHETIDTPNAKTSDVLRDVVNIVRPDGNRSQDPEKYKKDYMTLEKALEKDPNNIRYTFYLAQSYKDAGEFEKALKTYEKRVDMNGWSEEIFWSLLQSSRMKEALDRDPQEVIRSYKQAYAYRPTRVEPLYQLALYQRKINDYAESYKTASQGLGLKESNDMLFVEKWITDYGLLLEYSISAYWTEHYLEALLASNLMLANPELPSNVRECVQNNLKWINEKIAETTKANSTAIRESLVGAADN